MLEEPPSLEGAVGESTLSKTLARHRLYNWCTLLLWGFSSRLEKEFLDVFFQTHVSSERKGTVVLILASMCFVGCTMGHGWSKLNGTWNKLLWCLALILGPFVLCTLSVWLYCCRERLRRSSRYHLWRTGVPLAWRIEALVGIFLFEHFVAADAVYKEGWANFVHTAAVTSMCTSFWVLDIGYRVAFKVQWKLGLACTLLMALRLPSSCSFCSSDNKDRFVLVGGVIGSCLSWTVGFPSALLPTRDGACAAVSYFLLFSAGVLPSVVLGIEEAQQRAGFLERHIRRLDEGFFELRAAVSLLPILAAVVVLPYLALLWVLAVHISSRVGY